MKKSVLSFLAGMMAMAVIATFTVPAVAATIEAVFNAVNITVNGTKQAGKGQSFKLDNGTEVPYSIMYKGTTYLPLRKIGDVLGRDVTWEGKTSTVGINDKGFTPKTVNYGRTNPAAIGTPQTVDYSDYSDSYKATVKIVESVRGYDAWVKIKEANMFNDEPEAGYEYILARVEVIINTVKDDKAVSLSYYSFESFSSDNVEYDSASIVCPTPEFRGDVYAGGTLNGYLVFKVSQSDTAPKVVFGRSYDGSGGIWFKI